MHGTQKQKSLGAAVSISQTNVSLVALWTVRSSLRPAVQPANAALSDLYQICK